MIIVVDIEYKPKAHKFSLAQFKFAKVSSIQNLTLISNKIYTEFSIYQESNSSIEALIAQKRYYLGCVPKGPAQVLF